MIPIPYGKTYTLTMTGKAPKVVVCEQCGHEYVYYVARSSSGEGFSFLFLDDTGASNRARAEAEQKTLRTLEDACEPVPCRACGFVQQHMFARARQLRNRWMLRVGLYLLISSLFLLAPAIVTLTLYLERGSPTVFIYAIIFWLLALASTFGCIGLVLWRYFDNRNYDPNSEDVEVRKQLGRQLAVDRASLEESRNSAVERSANVIDYSEHTMPDRQE